MQAAEKFKGRSAHSLMRLRQRSQVRVSRGETITCVRFLCDMRIHQET